MNPLPRDAEIVAIEAAPLSPDAAELEAHILETIRWVDVRFSAKLAGVHDLSRRAAIERDWRLEREPFVDLLVKLEMGRAPPRMIIRTGDRP